MIVWALFDSGNGCYKKTSQDFENIEIYSIGMDKENKSNHFINLDLAYYSISQKENKLFDELDKLPKPDLIIASPPCESWSIASAMWGGNASWKQEKQHNKNASKFTIRSRKDYDLDFVQFKYDKSFINRINGELCIYNTIEIIKRYAPAIYVIENPGASRIWHYINDILDFHIEFDNLTYYNNYGYPISKATRFKSNINLNLDSRKNKSKVCWGDFSRNYNERSNIPLALIHQIYTEVIKHLDNTIEQRPGLTEQLSILRS
ncbi:MULTISPECIES: DNA methyltransferase [Pasteurellaceae]|uniref:DNA methyltransferase n=1 Tax=Pasteurella atlantica TaxID=2827233 RepID=A0AAW8CP60_9PAST|nr:DNA methyltransferase [Pasteurella atlantica]MBR0574162.1 DNA methyltransferase [Pasteurella atlantica]MDP8039271.1 DNA methyltransferase [Pasteurella atlantica]MDP8041363.1 DNA methyltransferase [Pasteurella atlantica]MDP8043499.1 DNA methyltransferase [Pasteurella atlantica]MDP8045583.1 DNA methyltransferase [Pasteurella atlantica]